MSNCIGEGCTDSSLHVSEVEEIKPEQIVVKTEEPVTEAPPQDPIAQASAVFGVLYPRFIARLETLSNKSMKRVIRSLIGVPLEEPIPNFKRDEEKEAYLIGERLLEAKSVIIIHALFEKQKDIESLMEVPTAEAPPVENVIEKEGE